MASRASLVRKVTRLSVLALLLVAPLTPPRIAAAGNNGDRSTGNGAVAMHEVRLRKLHLVRPDLIPYPIAFEVVC